MAKLSVAILAAALANAAAFVSMAPSSSRGVSLKAAEIWDPMGLYELGSGKSFDTFPNMFPNKQFLQAAEIKHGRQAMLAWTGVWATSQVCTIRNRFVWCVVDDTGQLHAGMIVAQFTNTALPSWTGRIRTRPPLSRFPQ
jgi:hypothetical protein